MFGSRAYIEQECKEPIYSEIYAESSVIVGGAKVADRTFRNQKVKLIYISHLFLEISPAVAVSITLSDKFGRVLLNSVPLTLITGIFVFDYLLKSNQIIITTQGGLGGATLRNLNFTAFYQ